MAHNFTLAPPLAPAGVKYTTFDFWIETIASALTTYYTPCLIFLGIIGNAWSVFVFYKSKLNIQSTSLYLSVLAISDTVYLLQLLPPWLNAMGITNLFHRRGFCQVFVYTFYASCCLSAWLVVAFTVERYVAVLYPLQRNSMCTLARAKSVIGLLTLFALLINLPVIKFASHSTNDCNIDLEYVKYAERFNMADTIVSFSLPLVIVVVLNIQITCGVWRRERQQRAVLTAQVMCSELGAERMQRQLPPLRSQHRVTRMLLIVSTVYVVLNLPAYTMRLLAYAYDMGSGPYSGRWAGVNQLALTFFNTNFGINFLLYCLTGQNFRRELCRSIPWLRNRMNRRVNDIQLVTRNNGRAGSVTASYVSQTEGSTVEVADTLMMRRGHRDRRHRSEPFIEVWTFDNSRTQRVQPQQPEAQEDMQLDVQLHTPPASEEIEMQELSPELASAAPAAAVPDAAAAVPNAAVTVPDAAFAVPDAAATVPDAAVTVPDAAAAVPDAAEPAPAPGSPGTAPAL